MRMLRIAFTFTMLFCLALPGFARDVAHIDSALNSAKLQGSGRLNWWGFHIYDASFYRAANPASSEFALDIRYHKSFLPAYIIYDFVRDTDNLFKTIRLREIA